MNDDLDSSPPRASKAVNLIDAGYYHPGANRKLSPKEKRDCAVIGL
jgi:hypothetical protein